MIEIKYQILGRITTEQLKSVARLYASNRNANISLLMTTLVEGGQDMPFSHLNSPDFGDIWHAIFQLEKVIGLCNGAKNPFWDGSAESNSMADEIIEAFTESGGIPIHLITLHPEISKLVNRAVNHANSAPATTHGNEISRQPTTDSELVNELLWLALRSGDVSHHYTNLPK